MAHRGRGSVQPQSGYISSKEKSLQWTEPGYEQLQADDWTQHVHNSTELKNQVGDQDEQSPAVNPPLIHHH